METYSATHTTSPASASETALRFYRTLADRSESENVGRYERHRRLAVDITDAARRADAVMRLELALRRTA